MAYVGESPLPGGETSRSEVIPQVCEQARERSRSEYRNDILNKRKTRKKCAALSFDRSTGTGTGTCTRYTSWVETTGTVPLETVNWARPGYGGTPR